MQIQKMLKKAFECWKGPEGEEYLIHYDIGKWDQWYYASRPRESKEIRYAEAVRIAKDWGLDDFPFPSAEEE